MSRRGAAVLLLAALLGACGTAADAPGRRSGGAEVVVFAAASLTDVFADLADAYAAAHPGDRVLVNTAGSQTLAHQIIQGAPADVLASADATQMGRVEEAGHLAGPAVTFATNRLAIAVEPGNPFGVRGLADLADPALVVVLPAQQVPAGAYARQALAAAGTTVRPASLEVDVRATLARVALGEADAAIVYASDVVAAGERVDGVDIPADANVVAAYRIAVVSGAKAPDAAAAFVDLVLGEQGQAILHRHGLDPR